MPSDKDVPPTGSPSVATATLLVDPKESVAAPLKVLTVESMASPCRLPNGTASTRFPCTSGRTTNRLRNNPDAGSAFGLCFATAWTDRRLCFLPGRGYSYPCQNPESGKSTPAQQRTSTLTWGTDCASAVKCWT